MSSSDKKAKREKEKEDVKTHKLALKGSAKLVSEFFEYAVNTILFQRGVYPPEDFTAVKKYGLNMLVTSDDQVKAYLKRILSQLNKWMVGGKISKLIVVITSKETGENIERWQFDVDVFNTDPPKPTTKQKPPSTTSSTTTPQDQENAASSTTTAAPAKSTPSTGPSDTQIQSAIAALFRQITASVTFLPTLSSSDAGYTFNVLVYADASSEVPLEWGDSDAREIEGGERVQLREFETRHHRVGTVVSYRVVE